MKKENSVSRNHVRTVILLVILVLVFIYLFAIVFKILLSGGMYDSAGVTSGPALMRHMIIPCLVISLQQIGRWVRPLRPSVLGDIQGEHIRSACFHGTKKLDVPN